MTSTINNYIGRFAPSPTGPLHFGSLLSALASYLDAKAHNGTWLVRIEDIDPPREVPGATKQILQTLENYGLNWDGEVIYQHQRFEQYREKANALVSESKAYYCSCNRQQIKTMGGIYDGTCRNSSPGKQHNLKTGVETSTTTARATRIKSELLSDASIQFDDLVQGPQQQNIPKEVGDFIIHRKDGLPAYQLAVAMDDIEQGITHVIRGHDLLDSTARQIYIMRLLEGKPPIYGHIPVAANALGQKLSKQNHAPALEEHAIGNQLYRALLFLNQSPPVDLQHETPANILKWGIHRWDINAIPKVGSILHAN